MGWDGMEWNGIIDYISPIYIIQFTKYDITSGIYTSIQFIINILYITAGFLFFFKKKKK